MTIRWLFFSCIFLLVGCQWDEDRQGLSLATITYDFTVSNEGWSHGFADYPAGKDDSVYYQLGARHAAFDGLGRAFQISGINHNADLFLYIKKKISGLRPNTNFTVTLTMEMACRSSALEGQEGSGDNIFIKTGATAHEPKSVIEGNRVTMNIDKGENAVSGSDMFFIGNLFGSISGAPYTNFTLNSFSNRPIETKSNSRGELWLVVGVDSNVKSEVAIYFREISVVLTAPY